MLCADHRKVLTLCTVSSKTYLYRYEATSSEMCPTSGFGQPAHPDECQQFVLEDYASSQWYQSCMHQPPPPPPSDNERLKAKDVVVDAEKSVEDASSVVLTGPCCSDPRRAEGFSTSGVSICRSGFDYTQLPEHATVRIIQEFKPAPKNATSNNSGSHAVRAAKLFDGQYFNRLLDSQSMVEFLGHVAGEESPREHKTREYEAELLWTQQCEQTVHNAREAQLALKLAKDELALLERNAEVVIGPDETVRLKQAEMQAAYRCFFEGESGSARPVPAY